MYAFMPNYCSLNELHPSSSKEALPDTQTVEGLREKKREAVIMAVLAGRGGSLILS
jgi:hypothetical protein